MPEQRHHTDDFANVDPRRVERAIEEIRQGRMVILVDDADRENEGDLTMAAELVTPEAINFMAKHARGLICMTMTRERAEFLQLPPMASQNTSPYGTAFTVSIEARKGVTTGISAADRAHTVRTAISDASRPDDLSRPGHMFPLVAQAGGVLVRTGQTEGSVDLARLAGLKPAGVICEIMRDDGTMARMPDLLEFARIHELLLLSIADIVAYRLEHELLVEKAADTEVDTEFGPFHATAFRSTVDDREALVLSRGDLTGAEAPLVRVHSGCCHGDPFPGALCDCGLRLRGSLQAIVDAGVGALLYLPPDLPQRSLVESVVDAAQVRRDRQVRARHPRGPQGGTSTGMRHYGMGAQILRSLGLRQIRLLSNSPIKLSNITGFGLTILDVVAIPQIPGSVDTEDSHDS
ncbi:MAG: 3,4-dihydroxy-2-butanone-4-phosphate synthase [Pseudomonadota bacterium]